MKKLIFIFTLFFVFYNCFSQDNWGVSAKKTKAPFRISGDIHTPEMYGAIANDGLSDATAWQNMYAAYADSSTIIVSGGKYIYDAAVGITSDRTVNILYTNNSYVDLMNFTGVNFLDFIGGGFTDCIDQDTLAVKGNQYIINPAMADSLSKNDLFLISTSTQYGGNDEQWEGWAGYALGETCDVWWIQGDTIWLKEPLYDSYPVCRVCKQNTITVNVNGLSLLMDPTKVWQQIGVVFRDVRNSTIQLCNITGSSAYGMHTYHDNNSLFFRNNFSDNIYDHSSRGLDIGITLAGSRNTTLSYNTMMVNRHSIDIGAIYVVSTNIMINNNLMVGQKFYTAMTHPGGQYITFKDNHIIGALKLSTINSTVEGNTIRNSTNNYYNILLSYLNINGTIDFIDIINNKLESTHREGIYANLNDGIFNNINIERNRGKINNDFVRFITTSTDTVVVVKKVKVKDNDFWSDVSVEAIDLWGDSLYIKKFLIDNNDFDTKGHGIRIYPIDTIESLEGTDNNWIVKGYHYWADTLAAGTSIQINKIKFFNENIDFADMVRTSDQKKIVADTIIYVNNLAEGWYADSAMVMEGTVILDTNNISVEGYKMFEH